MLLRDESQGFVVVEDDVELVDELGFVAHAAYASRERHDFYSFAKNREGLCTYSYGTTAFYIR